MKLAVSLLILLGLCVQSSASADDKLCALYWPGPLVSTTEDLKIEKIKLTVSCAEFRSINYIPRDWDFSITGPLVTTSSELRASAQPGGGMLPNTRELQGSFIISYDNESCFDVTVDVSFFGSKSVDYHLSKPQYQNPNPSKEAVDRELRCLPIHVAKK